MKSTANRRALIGGQLAQLADIIHRHMCGMHDDSHGSQLSEGAGERFWFEPQPRRDQHLVIWQGDNVGAAFDRDERSEKFGNPLHAALRLEVLDLLDEVVQVLRCGCDHSQRDIRVFADAADDVIGWDPHDTGVADRLGCGRITGARQRVSVIS